MLWHTAAPFLIFVNKNEPIPDIRNPFHVLHPSAEMWWSHGSWHCIYRLSDHTVYMKNDEQMEILSGEFGLFLRKEVQQQKAGALQHMWTDCCTVKTFWGHPPTNFLCVFVENESQQCICVQFAYLFSSSLVIPLINLFIWRKGQHTGEHAYTHEPFQEFLWAGL